LEENFFGGEAFIPKLLGVSKVKGIYLKVWGGGAALQRKFAQRQGGGKQKQKKEERKK